MTTNKTQWVRQSTAAKMADMTVQSFKYHIDQGHVQVVEEIDGCKFFDKQAILSWLEARRVYGS